MRDRPQIGTAMKSDGDVLDRSVAGRTVRESWALAEEALSLLPAGGGLWTLARDPSPANWIKVHRDASRNCKLQLLLFNYIYQKQAVPAACETCFKVKVVPRSLRELFAVYEAGGALPYTYKCGIDAESDDGVWGVFDDVFGDRPACFGPGLSLPHGVIRV